MTRPKKWFLDREEGDIILKYYSKTPVSKPNASTPLGAVQSVVEYDFSHESKGKWPVDKTVKVSS